MKTSPEKRALETAIGRCTNKTDKDYPRYGGRGIRVSRRWRDSVEAFLIDMGPKPSPQHSLDRKNNRGHYEPGNCRWATSVQQAQNRRSTRLCATAACLIRHLRRRGLVSARIGKAFGVSEKTIHRVCGRLDCDRGGWANALDDLVCLSTTTRAGVCVA